MPLHHARPHTALLLALCLLTPGLPGPLVSAALAGGIVGSGRTDTAAPPRSEGDVVPLRNPTSPRHGARAPSLQTVGDTVWVFRDSLETLTSPLSEDGWTHEDASGQPAIWHIDTLYACQNHAFWCGQVDSSWTGDPNRMGYGNSWTQYLQNYVDFTGAVSPYTLGFKYQMDIEDGYDYGRVQVFDPPNGWTTIATLTGIHHGTAGAPCDTFSVTIPDSIVARATPTQFRFAFESDILGSSADGLYPGDGWSVDNVTARAGLADLRFFDDMESGPGTWSVTIIPATGDKWRIASNVPSEQICTTNPSKVWLPVDPITNVLLQGMDDRLISPPVAIGRPDAAFVAFDVYRALSISSCFYYNLRFRTRNVGDPGWSAWIDPTGLIYFGIEKEWLRQSFSLPGAAGKDSVQIRIGIKDYGQIYCDGASSPAGTFVMFDNFAFGVIGLTAPTLSTSSIDLYNDTFRTGPFFADDNFNTARGDSLAVRIGASRGLLAASLFYRLNGGSFSSLPLTAVGGSAPGVYFGDVPPAAYPRGTRVEYYFSATDSLNETATLPADAVASAHYYDATILPAIQSASPYCPGDSANVLYVNGVYGLAASTPLDSSLAAVGLRYDRYDINAPDLFAGNSPGGADPAFTSQRWPGATAADLARYTAIVWDFGERSSGLLSAPDQQLLRAWLALPGRNRGLLLSGDNIAYDLVVNQRDIGSFLSCTLGATYLRDVWETPPQDSLNPVLVGASGTYTAGTVYPYEGGCPSINRFDGLATSICSTAGGRRMWLRYPVNLMAAVERRDTLGTAGGDSTKTVLLAAGLGSMVSAVPRNVFLWQTVVKEFETPYCFVPTGVSEGAAGAPAVRPTLHPAAPNPFNPATAIRFTLPRAAHARVMVFDVAGGLVRTLADGPYPAGTHVLRWDGRDDRGRDLASGAYFYRLEADGVREARKLILLR